jgi:hypothetical protein
MALQRRPLEIFFDDFCDVKAYFHLARTAKLSRQAGRHIAIAALPVVLLAWKLKHGTAEIRSSVPK